MNLNEVQRNEFAAWYFEKVVNIINLLLNDRDVIPIVQPINTAPRNVTEDASFFNDDDEVDAYEEDDESVEEYANEKIDEENDSDIEKDDDRHNYHVSYSDYKIFKNTYSCIVQPILFFFYVYIKLQMLILQI